MLDRQNKLQKKTKNQYCVWLKKKYYGFFTAQSASTSLQQSSQTRTGLFELPNDNFVLTQASQNIWPQLENEDLDIRVLRFMIDFTFDNDVFV